MAMMGTAVHNASEELRENLRQMAAKHHEAAPEDLVFEDSGVGVRGTGETVSFASLAASAHNDESSLPEGVSVGALSVETTFDTKDEEVAVETEPADENALGNISMDYPSSAQIVVVSVDPDTGDVTVEEHVVVDDVGSAVNPNVVEGQIEGGAVQGVGAALYERLEYDDHTGQLRNPNLSDYGVPTAPDAPDVVSDYVEIPSESTPGGWKGVAEGPYIVAPAAVANAVSDAIGVPVTELPATPERVRAAIRERDE